MDWDKSKENIQPIRRGRTSVPAVDAQQQHHEHAIKQQQMCVCDLHLN